MKAPDKIYVAADSELGFKNTKTAIAFSFEQKFDTVEYIRKDALLEWAKEQKALMELGGHVSIDDVIDKISSI